MNISKTLKIAALALVVVTATAGASMAAVMNQNSAIKANHFNFAPNVDWVSAGQHVSILNSWGQWYKVNPAGPGPNGWVKKFKVSAGPGPGPFPGWGGGFGGSFCVNGQNAQFCISGGY